MKNDEYIEYLNVLEDTVWKTRKNRINAAERLLSTNCFVQHINIYYACLSAAIAIISLWYTDKALTMLGAILAPIVTICIAFLNSQRYEQRAADIKQNYIELKRVLYSIQRLKLEASDTSPNLSIVEELEDRYCKLMDKVENHRPCDYWRTCFESGNWDKPKSEQFSQKMKRWFHILRYHTYVVLRWSMHGFAYLAPIVGYALLRSLFVY